MKVSEHQISRRNLVGASAAGSAAVLTGLPVMGGGPAAAMAQDANIPTPREETLVIEQTPTNIWDSFNPFIPNGEAYDYGLVSVCREMLFYVNYLTGETKPWLGKEWTYNEDYTSCTLTIQEGITWNDGEPFTTDDILFTHQMLIDNPTLNGAAGLEKFTVTADDDYNITWTWDESDTRFHYRFLAGTISDGVRIMPRHIWEGEDPATFAANPPVQTGPYILKEASATKMYYLWEKNPDYWNKANFDPAPQYVLYRSWSEIDTAVQEFLAGNIDDSHQINRDYLNQQNIASQTDKYSPFLFADPCPRGFHLNVESPSGLFKTKEGRWVIQRLIDRELIANTIYQPPRGTASYPWANYGGWEVWAPDEVMDKFDTTFSLDAANELLDGLGATERDGDGIRILDGKPLKLTMICPLDTASPEYQAGMVLVDSAKEVGIDMELKALAWSAHWDAFDTGDYDLSVHWICGMQFDPVQFFNWYHSENYFPVGERTNRGNAVRFQNADFDALVDELRISDPTLEENKQKFFDTLELFMDESPTIASVQQVFPVFFSTSVWEGWPTEEDPYAIPGSWWGHYMFTIGGLRRAGS
ncbi:MAG: ABC transporter substrate-binding protein [Thermomicrobiales bacterium]|nr:ABC transporter substrate-binding protein [Thermomicrobiales bacterium]MCO5217704.1 ABC transporter substrate-binding protein [Thermomicrobiales bacterium]MCO5228217.1 ABC transporter substrate-binding protein [Thermomicrobiales bacterium]